MPIHNIYQDKNLSDVISAHSARSFAELYPRLFMHFF